LLLTSDEPVVLFSGGEHSEEEAIGVATADEVWFPLDPKHLLILGRPDDPGPFVRIPGQPVFAEQANWLVAQNAYEKIFLHPDRDLKVPKLPPAGAPVCRSGYRTTSQCSLAITSRSRTAEHSGVGRASSLPDQVLAT
jgi:hypothetical protein